MKILPPDAKFSDLSTHHLLENLHDSSLIVRARILTVLGARMQESPLVFDAVKKAIVDSANKSARVMGLTSVSWFGIITVLENGTEAQKQAISQLMANWDSQDKKDLSRYIKDYPEHLKYIA